MRVLLLLLAFLLSTPGLASGRLAVFGDVHGAEDNLIALLQGNSIIDSNGRWIADDTTLVSLGDLVDRGPRSRAVMDLLRRLQIEASEAGGEVLVLLGNHEAMNLTGNLRDVSSDEFAAFAQDTLPDGIAAEPDKPAGYSQLRHALGPAGEYGAWLLGQPAIAVRGDTAFVHGGLASPIRRAELAKTNQDVVRAIENAAAMETDEQTHLDEPSARLLGPDGPLWYRGTAACHELLETERLQAALAALAVKRLVIGHTPTPSGRPESRFDGAVVTMDTGMLTEVYGGQPYLLLIQGNDVAARDVSGNPVSIEPRSAVRLGSDARERAIADELTRAWAASQPSLDENNGARVEIANRQMNAVFVPASKEKVRRAIAAWQLDRHLGFDFVPLTFATTVNGRRGYVQVSPGQWRTERQRQSEGRRTPNYCAEGHVFHLVTTSDALLRATPRSADELSYSRRSWDIRLTGHDNSFGRRSRVELPPDQPAIPSALRRRLEAWDEDTVQGITNRQLSKSDLRALLARRDALLTRTVNKLVSNQMTP